ncbi:hypothetical protein CHUAL_010957 [Chamberlinius hualienensis]
MDVMHEMVQRPDYNIHLGTDPPSDEVLRRCCYYYCEHFIKGVILANIRNVTKWSTRYFDDDLEDVTLKAYSITHINMTLSRIFNYIIAVHGGENVECNHPTDIDIWSRIGLTEVMGNALTFRFAVIRAACIYHNLLESDLEYYDEIADWNSLLLDKFYNQFFEITVLLNNFKLSVDDFELIYAIAATFHSSTFHSDMRDISKEGINLRLLWRTCYYKISSNRYPDIENQRWNAILKVVFELIRISDDLNNTFNNSSDESAHKYRIMALFFFANISEKRINTYLV